MLVHPDTVRGIVNAWTITGPRPDVHHAAQTKLRTEWPTLAAALDKLASDLDPHRRPQ